jgi:bacterioferritin-associated ferredoxin
MIVCICNAVSDKTIRSRLAEGMTSFDELQGELGVALCCGKCAEAVHHLIEQAGAPYNRSAVCYLQKEESSYAGRPASHQSAEPAAHQ